MPVERVERISFDEIEQQEIDLRRRFRSMPLGQAWVASIRYAVGWILLGLAWDLVERYTTPTTKARFDALWVCLSNDMDVANEGLEEAGRIASGRRSDD